MIKEGLSFKINESYLNDRQAIEKSAYMPQRYMRPIIFSIAGLSTSVKFQTHGKYHYKKCYIYQLRTSLPVISLPNTELAILVL